MTNRQHGVALVVTLVLLSGIGALALAAAAAASAALAMSGHQQAVQNAFEAAEAGIAQSLARTAATRAAVVIAATPFPDDGTALATFEAVTNPMEEPGTLPLGFSIGESPGTFAARHFYIVADGHSGRGARIRLEQGFYLVEPAG